MKFLLKTAPLMSMVVFLMLSMLSTDMHAQRRVGVAISNDGRAISSKAKRWLERQEIQKPRLIRFGKTIGLETKNGLILLERSGNGGYEMPALTGRLRCGQSKTCNSCHINQEGENITCYCTTPGNTCTFILEKIRVIEELGIESVSETKIPSGQTTLTYIGDILNQN